MQAIQLLGEFKIQSSMQEIQLLGELQNSVLTCTQPVQTKTNFSQIEQLMINNLKPTSELYS